MAVYRVSNVCLTCAYAFHMIIHTVLINGGGLQRLGEAVWGELVLRICHEPLERLDVLARCLVVENVRHVLIHVCVCVCVCVCVWKYT
jgi:hypothetical protein